MRNNFFDNIYDFIAVKAKHIFAIVEFAAFAASIFFTCVGGIANDGSEFLHYLFYLVFYGLILTGLMFGYFKKSIRLLFASFISFLVLTVANGLVGDSWGISVLDNAPGVYIAFWIFRLVFDLVAAAYLVLVVLINAFSFKGLEKASHYVFLGILPAGLLYWIFGIVMAANDYGWTNALIPLFTCASMLFIPAALAIGAPEKEAPAPVKEEAKEEPKEEVKEEKPQEEVVEPEVEEEPKE
jgi:hypothetical protein